MPRNRFFFVALALSAALFATPAGAELWKDCTQQANTDLSIRACTTILERGQESVANHAKAYNYRGIAYGLKGDYGRAIADFGRAIELNPKDTDAYNSRAWTYFKAGKAAEALPDADRSLELRPDDASALNTRGHIFEALGRREEAITDYRRDLSMRPDSQDSKKALARLGASP